MWHILSWNDGGPCQGITWLLAMMIVSLNPSISHFTSLQFTYAPCSAFLSPSASCETDCTINTLLLMFSTLKDLSLSYHPNPKSYMPYYNLLFTIPPFAISEFLISPIFDSNFLHWEVAEVILIFLTIFESKHNERDMWTETYACDNAYLISHGI